MNKYCLINSCKVFLFVVFFVISSIAFASEIMFKQILPDENIEISVISSIIQDHNGFIWFGTNNVLSKYDGYEITTYENVLNTEVFPVSAYNIISLLEDKSGNIWIGTLYGGLNKFNPKTETFESYTQDNSNLQANSIRGLAEDKYGNIWIASFGEGLSKFDPSRNTFSNYIRESDGYTSGLSSDKLTSIYIDHKERIWLGTYNAGLNIYDINSGKIWQYSHDANKPDSLSHNSVWDIHEDSNNNIWVLTATNLDRWNLKTIGFKHYQPKGIYNRQFSSQMYHDQSGAIWIADDDGLLKVDPKDMQISHYRHHPDKVGSLSETDCLSVFVDNSNILWVGTRSKGINKAILNTQKIEYYTHVPDKKSIGQGIVNQITMDRDGSILVLSENSIISKLDRNHDVVSQYSADMFASDTEIRPEIQRVHPDKDNILWIESRMDGIKKFNTTTGNIKHYFNHNISQAENDDLYYTALDNVGRLWFQFRPYGKKKGVGYLDTNTEEIYNFEDKFPKGLNGFKTRIFHIIQDNLNSVWFAHTSGITRFDESKKSFKHFDLGGEITVNYIYPENDILWLASDLGLIKFNKITKNHQFITDKHQIGENINSPLFNIVSISNDNSDNLWILTYLGGLIKYSSESDIFSYYDNTNGLKGNKSLRGVSLYDETENKLYIGREYGFNVFNPNDLQNNTNKPNTVITNFKINDISVPLVQGIQNSILDKNISYADSLTLQHHQKNISLTLSSLEFTMPNKNHYAYFLEGYHDEWRYLTSGIREVNLSELSPGDYRFHYKGSNNSGLWDEKHKTLIITILEPWLSISYYAYIPIFVLVIVLVVRARLSYLEKRKLELEHEVIVRTEEISHKNQTIENLLKTKDELFANISHELRTPLTLIIGPAKSLIKNAKTPYEIENGSVILRSAYRLLRLVNQFLELSRLRHQSESLDCGQVDSKPLTYISLLTENIVSMFKIISEKNSIKLKIDIQPSVWVYCRQNSYEIIITNLLSNAIKNTPINGMIEVSITFEQATDCALLSVKDSGTGIPSEYHSKIFERFSNLNISANAKDVGAGIGLSLVKQLVSEARGNISLISEKHMGAEFIIRIPGCIASPIGGNMHSENDYNDDYIDNSILEKNFLESDLSNPVKLKSDNELNDASDKHQLLIIEDNVELCNYLYDLYNGKYNCLISTNGEQGLDLARREVPDIILCDIMMPGMDGYGVCKELRNDEKTCHIPVIFLTALGDHDHKIKGLKLGAYDFIAKPFDPDELGIRIGNLINYRGSIKKYFQTNGNVSNNGQSILECTVNDNDKDAEFLKKVKKVMEENFHNPSFTVKNISSFLFITERQLLRKITAIRGISSSDLLRWYRMDKAKYFLIEGYNVTETSFRVGYSSSNSFSVAFREFYGKSPKKYIKDLTLKD